MTENDEYDKENYESDYVNYSPVPGFIIWGSSFLRYNVEVIATKKDLGSFDTTDEAEEFIKTILGDDLNHDAENTD